MLLFRDNVNNFTCIYFSQLIEGLQTFCVFSFLQKTNNNVLLCIIATQCSNKNNVYTVDHNKDA